jgi:hypothetical protein
MAVRPRSVAASIQSLSSWYLVNQRSLFLNLIDLIRWTMRRTYPLPVDRQMTALNAWESRAGQIGNGRNPPDPAVRIGCR